MANRGDQGVPGPTGTHPRMTSELPQGPGSREQQSGGQDITGRVGEALETARESVVHGAQNVADEARTLWNDTTRLIRQYPVGACGIALGAGFLLGCCMFNFFSSSGDYMTRRMSQS